MLVSIVIPVYKSEDSLVELVDLINNQFNAESKFACEIIMINDGSSDNSWKVIKGLCKKKTNVKGINFSRNFGQHMAITAGIEIAKGNYIVVIDCDLQYDPIYIPVLLNELEKGNDIVFTYIKKREHNFLKNITAKIFNKVFNYLVENKDYSSDKNVGTFSAINRKVATAYLNFNDYQRHYLMVLRWLGFTRTYIEIVHKTRKYGKSSYTFMKLVDHAIAGITSQSNKLLLLNVLIGFVISFISFIGLFVIIALYFLIGFQSGWASLAALILFSTGIILVSIGTVGIYVGKTFDQAKNRPKYIIDEILNNK
jgi:glycosyltransferase involved in cell wall biosynthesis